ncbi:XrtA/PEP-CTERM system amidotransferase [Photobacterium aphoticum]|uniref:asparagine synthase (glutamine-hydrolyzing) n=1 Tax=Photobacterium aphoticum TaxID=754436 RepID=A0A0J1GML4_9GAMM|nr:XrtA/PEP-CTERM system amidotransferase [Photobacterium aphoticum]KLV01000.1 asparagine synthase [Photobacterium aphoticum]PSU58446.1 amidotransferase 1, exosortase A system-associated [Photobacterium aphoticum]GHA37056.1 amidotransferase 1, exosortase A system-associated [Photobacterium aphoticum]
MCGISGIFNLHRSTPIDEALLKRINRLQQHRGPDDEGYYVDAFAALAHRRLSIIDLSGGHQPLFNEDNSVVVVFNGEIYNYRELAQELSALGHQFRTLSDTEVIVHAWEAWGEDCVKRLRGMFAFAVWDTNTRTLFIGRDRLGKKPLFYTVTPQGQLIFASELKVLVGHPDVCTELRPEMAEEFFMYGYIPEPYSAYQNIFKLEPGHTITVRPQSGLASKQYWDLPAPSRILSWEETQYSLIDKLKEAVNIRLVADVPLGAFLSGGVDSSAIVALMAELQDSPVNTCSIGFDERDFDESDYAQQVAERYHTHHWQEIVSPHDISLIDQLADIYDEPYADSSALPTYKVCQLASQRVKVALSGDGGDEIFGGYRRHRMHLAEQRLRDAIPQPIRKPLFGTLGNLYPKADWAPRPLRAKTTFQSLAMNMVEGYASSVSKIRTAERQKLFSPAYHRQLDGYNGIDILYQHAKQFQTDDPLKQVQYLDIKTWLAGDILTKVDRASMAHGLEVRAPLLDHAFIEWAYQINSQDNIRHNEGKYAFKKSLERYVSNDILYRPKMGFGMPIAHWFRTSLQSSLYDNVLSDAMCDSGFFNVDQLKKMIHEHQQGYRDHGVQLWCLLMFSQFMVRQ